jgi:hypothetical protein
MLVPWYQLSALRAHANTCAVSDCAANWKNAWLGVLCRAMVRGMENANAGGLAVARAFNPRRAQLEVRPR